MATINSTGNGLSGITGTGNFVGNTNPTLTTPRIGQINDINGNASLEIYAAASPVNYFQIVNAATGAEPAIQAIGLDADIGITLGTKGLGTFGFLTESLANQYTFYSGTSFQHGTNFSFPTTAVTRTLTFPDADGTLLMTGQAITSVPSIAFSPSTGGIVGTASNDNAGTGYVGEYVTATSPSPVSLTTNTIANVISISLTAGDWDVFGSVLFDGNDNMTQALDWVSVTSATLPAASLYSIYRSINLFNSLAIPTPYFRASLSATTTIYLSVSADFALSAVTANGTIWARRVR